MRISDASDDLVWLPPILIALCALLSCSENDHWDYDGLRQVWLETMGLTDYLHVADTLVVTLEGEGGCDLPEFSHVEITRDSSRINLTVWADCYEWSGPGIIPPTNTWVQCESEIPPPFHPGQLLLVAYRPDSSTVSDTVTVIP